MQMSLHEQLFIEARGVPGRHQRTILTLLLPGGSFVEVPHGKRRLGVWTPG